MHVYWAICCCSWTISRRRMISWNWNFSFKRACDLFMKIFRRDLFIVGVRFVWVWGPKSYHLIQILIMFFPPNPQNSPTTDLNPFSTVSHGHRHADMVTREHNIFMLVGGKKRLKKEWANPWVARLLNKIYGNMELNCFLL